MRSVWPRAQCHQKQSRPSNCVHSWCAFLHLHLGLKLSTPLPRFFPSFCSCLRIAGSRIARFVQFYNELLLLCAATTARGSAPRMQAGWLRNGTVVLFRNEHSRQLPDTATSDPQDQQQLQQHSQQRQAPAQHKTLEQNQQPIQLLGATT